jgi:CelD/BcsL family acetyltransferase involved in cellulose biosynthesis
LDDTITGIASYKRKAMSNIKSRIIVELAEFKTLSDVWDNLLQESGENNSLFLTYEWISTVWRHFGNKGTLNIVVIEKDGLAIGIFPLMKAEYRLGILKFNVLETIGAYNYNLVGFFSNKYQDEVIDAFCTYLTFETEHNDSNVKLEFVPGDCLFLKLMRERLPNVTGKMVYSENTTTLAPYIEIKTTWDSYFQSLSKNRRKRLRKALKNSFFSNIEYKYFLPENMKDGLNKLFELHIKRWKSINIRSPFTDPQMKEFYRDIAECFSQKGWLHFTSLLADGQMVSMIFAYVYGQKFYSVTLARDPEYSELNLGHLHHRHVIKEAFEKGLVEYDFLRGDEPHKFHWTNNWRRYQRVIIVKARMFPKLNLLYKNALLRILEIIRNRHSLIELVGLITFHIKNRKLVQRMDQN